jgi:hypothetical protein
VDDPPPATFPPVVGVPPADARAAVGVPVGRVPVSLEGRGPKNSHRTAAITAMRSTLAPV